MYLKVLALLAAVALPLSMQASTVTFNLLDSNGHTIDGTGSLVLTSPPGAGVLNDNDISTFTINVTNPYTQTFTPVTAFVTASFDSHGNLTNLQDFALDLFGTGNSVSLSETAPGLTFVLDTGGFNFNQVASGTIVQTNMSPAPTPEPSSILLFGTGLVAVAGAARRKIGLV